MRKGEIELESPVCLEDDAISTELINKNITPTNGTSTNASPGQSISTLVSNTNSRSNSAKFSGQKSPSEHKTMLGTLPTSSTVRSGENRNKMGICRFYKKVWPITRYNGVIDAINKIII